MKLPLKFKPKYAYDLIRVGSKHDGGYLIEKTSFINSKFLFSFGISTNWDFEKDFIYKRNIQLIAFDGSINEEFWQNKKIIALEKMKKLSLKDLYQYMYIKYSFNKFFSKKNFVPKFISNKLPNSMTFKEAINLSEINEDIFLKIDIEGSEYEILGDILENQNKIIGIAIEFHQCNFYIKDITNFVNNLALEIVHIHANNYDDNKGKIIPDTMEFTFAKNPKGINKFKKLPHPYDRPNRSKNKEIILDFDD